MKCSHIWMLMNNHEVDHAHKYSICTVVPFCFNNELGYCISHDETIPCILWFKPDMVILMNIQIYPVMHMQISINIQDSSSVASRILKWISPTKFIQCTIHCTLVKLGVYNNGWYVAEVDIIFYKKCKTEAVSKWIVDC